MMPVSVFLTEISAPAITAPVASVIVPEMVAPVTCACRGMDVIRPSARIHAKNTKRAIFGFMYLLLSVDFKAPLYSSLTEKLRTLRIFGRKPRRVATISLLAACLFETSVVGGRQETAQLYPDRSRNKRTDPVHDGIERAEPNLAPSRHRLITELVNGRFRNIKLGLTEEPTVATTLGVASIFSLQECQVISHIRHFSYSSTLVRNALFL